MDVEKMKKINALAAELKKHRIVQNEDDAVRKAEEMVLSEASPVASPEKPQEQPGQEALRHAEELLKESNRAVKAELDMLKKGLLQLNEEFKQFKRDTTGQLEKVKQLALSAPPEVKPAPKPETASPEPSEAEGPVEKPAEAPPTKEKKDDYSPGGESVAVENVFYFGKK